VELYIHSPNTSFEQGWLSSTVLGYGLNDRGVPVPAGVGNFSLHHRLETGSGAQLPIQWVPGALSPGVKRLGREADHSSPSSEVKEYVEIYLHSPIRLHGVVLI
jgi:hypothetical protein